VNFLINLGAFVVVIIILVGIHEYGHYWVAKKFDVKILRFSIGFGKVIKSFKRGETEFTLCAIPLGGYVKMLDENEAKVADFEQHRAFNQKSVYQRFGIVLAGPAANFALAIILYTFIFISGVHGVKPIVGEVDKTGLFAQIGLQTGDELLSINDVITPSIGEFSTQFMRFSDAPDMHIQTRSNRSNLQTNLLNLKGDFLSNPEQGVDAYLGFKFALPSIPAVIDKVMDNSAALAAGLKNADEILAVDGVKINDWRAFVKIVQTRPIKPLKLLIKRNNLNLTLDLTPKLLANKPKVGVSILLPENYLKDWQVLIQKNPLDAFLSASSKVYQLSLLNLTMIKKMLLGETPANQIGGPISIANYAGKSAEISLTAFLSFLALISIGLGLLNLLPIPLLDGGHLFFYLIEMLKGSRVSETTQQIAGKLGLLVILSLTFFALYNDLLRL
jgi:regulator of sigma E protease